MSCGLETQVLSAPFLEQKSSPEATSQPRIALGSSDKEKTSPEAAPPQKQVGHDWKALIGGRSPSEAGGARLGKFFTSTISAQPYFFWLSSRAIGRAPFGDQVHFCFSFCWRLIKKMEVVEGRIGQYQTQPKEGWNGCPNSGLSQPF